jgi:(p)ppGpp synthase/HD superfamily hydrolase
MTYTTRFSEALALAHELHLSQKRKRTEIPYISHLLLVAGIAIEHGANEEEAIAALLHDAIEDSDATVESLTAQFGVVVAQIVAGCTDDVPGVDRASVAGWQQRKEAYLAHLTEEHLTPSILLVSCADKLANARSILADIHASGDAVYSPGSKQGSQGHSGTTPPYRIDFSRYLAEL